MNPTQYSMPQDKVDVSSTVSIHASGVHASASVNIGSPGKKASLPEGTLKTHVEVTRDGQSIEAASSIQVGVPPPATIPDDLEQELEQLVDAAVQPQPEAEPSSKDAPTKTEEELRLEQLSSMIQGMLKRPGTIDIQAVQDAISAAQAQPAAQQPVPQTQKSQETQQPTGQQPVPQEQKSQETQQQPTGQQPVPQTQKSQETQQQPTGQQPVPQEQKSQETQQQPTGQQPVPQPEKSADTQETLESNGRKKKTMTDEEREAHNYYMKFYRSLRPQASSTSML